MQLKPVDGQVVVIVGANSGIGRITAMKFAERGAKVVLAGRSLPALEELASEITGKGGQAIAVAAEVSDFEQVESLAGQAAVAFGRIDTWVHLAAVSMYARFEDTKPEEFRRIVEVNLLGQVYGAMAALPYLRREGRGALIHISSVEARRSLPLQSAYTTSKHGMIGFLDTLRMELEHEGAPISVANIMPASINTPLFDKALTRMGVKPRPIPPVYEPELVADAILYAAEHPARDIFVGGAGKGLGLLERLSPRLGDLLLRRAAFRMQQSHIPKSDDAPNNLFTHLDGFNTVKGAYSHEARGASLYTWLETHPSAKAAAKWGATASLVAAGALLSGRAMRSRRKRFKLPFKLPV